MESSKNVQINLSIPEHYRNLLRKMAAEKMLRNPSEAVSGASIATELLVEALKEITGEGGNKK